MLAVVAGVLVACGAIPAIGGIPVTRDVDDPMGAASGAQVGRCGAMLNVFIALPDLATVDRMIMDRGDARGIYRADDLRLYYGPLEEAAAAFGGEALFIGKGGEAWIRTEPGAARQLAPIDTPAGRRLWMETSSSSVTACGVNR